MSITLTADRWSQLPELIEHYNQQIDATAGGISRLFGYASLIKNHVNEKPAHSRTIPNERAKLYGMQVGMNALAAGENEYRGTRGTYTDAHGREKPFANVGVYAGLEPASTPDGYADGMTITASPEDRNASLMAYIKRELGVPPAGYTLEDAFAPGAKEKFAALKGSPQDPFGMYKLHVADVEIQRDNGLTMVPAITVSTNENSTFSAIGYSPMQVASLILDGQGVKTTNGQSTAGGAALDYFQNFVMGTMRELNLTQPHLLTIEAAVEKLSGMMHQLNEVYRSNPDAEEEYKAVKAILEPNAQDLDGWNSPYFYPGQNSNNRPAPSAEDRDRPENKNMPRTAVEKYARVSQLYVDGKTKPPSR